MRSKLASSIAILLNYGAKWRVLYYIFYVLCLDFELALILDVDFLFSKIKTYQRANKNIYSDSLLSYNGPLLSSVGSTYLPEYIRDMSVTVAYVFLAILLLLISIPAMTIAFHYPWKSLIHSRVFLDLLSTFLSYYDYLFLVCISVFSECIACADKTILEQQVGIASDYLDTDSRVKSFGILEVVYSQSRLNSNVTCRGIDHIFLSLLSGLLLLGNFFLKYMNNFILSHRPNPLLPSKHNGGDMIHLSIVIAMMLLKVVLRFSGGQSILPVQIFYLTSLVLLVLDLIIHTNIKPFYSPIINNWRMVEILVMICAVLLVLRVIILGDHFAMNSRTNSTMLVGILLTLTLCVKLYSVLSQRRQQKATSRQNKGASWQSSVQWANQSHKDTLLFIEKSIAYVRNTILDRTTPAEKYSYMLEVLELYRCKRAEMSKKSPVLETIEQLLQRFVHLQHLSMAEMEEYISSEKKQELAVKQSLLDSFEEPIGTEIKSIIRLMGILLEDAVKNYDINILTVPQHLFNTYIFHLCYFEGKLQKASLHLKQIQLKCLAENKTSLENEVLLEFVSICIDQNLKTSNSFMGDCRSFLNYQGSQKNFLNLELACNFINSFGSLKVKVAERMKEVIELLQQGVDNRLTSERIFSESLRSLDAHRECQLIIDKLEQGVNTKSTPLLFVSCFYEYVVNQDIKRGLKLLKLINSRKFTIGIDSKPPVLEVSELGIIKDHCLDSEPVIFGVSFEEDINHEINYVTSNVERKLGFSVGDLMNQDLGIIIPQPMTKAHRTMFDPNKAKGKLLEDKKGRRLFIYCKDKTVKETWICLRINSDLWSGLKFISRIGIQRKDDQRQFIIVSTVTRKVLEFTDNLEDLFRKSSPIDFYNPQLSSLITTFMKVESCGHENIRTMDQLTTAGIDLSEIETYIKLVNGYSLILQTFDVDAPQLGAVIKMEYIEFTTQSELSLLIEMASLSDSEQVFHASPKKVYTDPRRKSLVANFQNMINYFQKDIGKGISNIMASQDIAEVTAAEPLSNSSGKERKQNMQTPDASPPAGLESFAPILGEINKLIKPCRALNELFRDRLHDGFAAISTFIAKNNAHRPRYRTFNRKNSNAPSFARSIDSRSDGYNLYLSFMMISAMLAQQRRRLPISKRFMMIVFSVLVILSSIFGLGINKHIVQHKVFKELRERVKRMDQSGWSIWAGVLMPTDMECNRLIYEGIITDDFYADLGLASIYTNSNYRKGWMIDYIYLNRLQIEMDMLNVTYDRFKAPNYMGISDKLRMYSIETDEATGAITWHEKFMTPQSATQYIQPYINSYIYYRDDSTWSGGPVNGNPELDIETEFLRRNMQGDLQSHLYKQMKDLDHYLMSTSNYSYELIAKSLVVDSAMVGGFIFLLLIAFAILRHWTHLQIKRLFTFRLSEVDVERQHQVFLARKFDLVCADESRGYEILESTLKATPHKIVFATENNSDQVKRKKVQLIRDRYQHLAVKRDNFSFRLFTNLFKLFVLLALGISMELIYYFSDVKTARVVKNIIELIDNNVEMWNYYVSINDSILKMIVWNDTMSVMGKQTSRLFISHLDYFDKKIIPTYERLLNEDLGNFTQYYSFKMAEQSFCEGQIGSPFPFYEFCGQGILSLYDAPSLPILKKIVILLNRSYQQWLNCRDSETCVSTMIHNPEFRAYNAYSIPPQGVNTEIYYMLSLPLMLTLDSLLKPGDPLNPEANTKAVFYIKFYGSIYLLLLVLIVVLVFRGLYRIFEGLAGMMLILPIRLLLHNRPLLQRLKNSHSS